MNHLKPWQAASVEHLLTVLRTHDSAVDASDTGVGKTFVGLAVAQALQLPTLVICPKIAVSNWSATAEEFFGEKFSVINYETLRLGKSGYGSWTNQERIGARRSFIFICQRCLLRFGESETMDPCTYSAGGQHCIETKPRPIKRGNFQFHPAVKFIVWDEVHKCGAMKSLNAEMLIAAKRQRIKMLLLSATLFDSILKCKAIGHALDMFSV